MEDQQIYDWILRGFQWIIFYDQETPGLTAAKLMSPESPTKLVLVSGEIDDKGKYLHKFAPHKVSSSFLAIRIMFQCTFTAHLR